MQYQSAAEVLQKRVFDRNLDIRSGVYAIAEPDLDLRLNDAGYFDYSKPPGNTEESAAQLLQLSAFGGEAPIEPQIAEALFGHSKGTLSDPILGVHLATFAGWVGDAAARARSSSGGLTTWLATQLLSSGEVDGIIHMHSGDGEEPLFQYRISRDLASITQHSKTRYFPGELSQVLREVQHTNERFALVAIPSIAYEVRLLQRQQAVFAERIPYVLGLLCGHQKSANYSEYLGWRLGFVPGSVTNIDFRVKDPASSASEYQTSVTGWQSGKLVTKTVGQRETYGTNWSFGFFKANFSDFTEDVFNETADVVFGDAWIDPYVQSPLGTNVVIIRNPAILHLFEMAAKSGEIHLESLSAAQVVQSQSGLVHHNIEDLEYRLAYLSKEFGRSGSFLRRRGSKLSLTRKAVQRQRIRIGLACDQAYLDAKAAHSLALFDEKMTPLTNRLERLAGFDRVARFAGKGPQAWLQIIKRRMPPR